MWLFWSFHMFFSTLSNQNEFFSSFLFTLFIFSSFVLMQILVFMVSVLFLTLFLLYSYYFYCFLICLNFDCVHIIMIPEHSIACLYLNCTIDKSVAQVCQYCQSKYRSRAWPWFYENWFRPIGTFVLELLSGGVYKR